MIITQTFTMARWQIVVKPSEATKPTKTKMKKMKNEKKKWPLYAEHYFPPRYPGVASVAVCF